MNQEQVEQAYESVLQAKASEKFVGVGKADLKIMFEGYCDADGKLDFSDAMEFANVVQGKMIDENLGWISQLMDKAIS